VELLELDLAMWTYNSAKTLEESLSTIEWAIPKENICHKIAVDGGSKDQTFEILKSHGWTVEEAPQKGIPYQANHALGMVDTEFFASFEHDILLSLDWFETTSKTILADASVGCVQGVRLYRGSKTMQAIERWQYDSKLIPRWEFSIDNDLYRTQAVRNAGGFSNECMASADGILRRSMFKKGYKWITDYSLVSGHIRKSFSEQFKHQLRAAELARYTWSSNPETGSRLRRLISMLGGNPRYYPRMAVQTRMLRVPLAWFILRFEKGFYANLPHEGKSVKPVAMDDWYLKEFKKEVLTSTKQIVAPAGNEATARGRSRGDTECRYCGGNASFQYSVPQGWGNILPQVRRGPGRIFFACSEEHAAKIAERVFKRAFEYVIPESPG